jgi:hypothetical protein
MQGPDTAPAAAEAEQPSLESAPALGSATVVDVEKELQEALGKANENTLMEGQGRVRQPPSRAGRMRPTPATSPPRARGHRPKGRRNNQCDPRNDEGRGRTDAAPAARRLNGPTCAKSTRSASASTPTFTRQSRRFRTEGVTRIMSCRSCRRDG